MSDRCAIIYGFLYACARLGAAQTNPARGHSKPEQHTHKAIYLLMFAPVFGSGLVLIVRVGRVSGRHAPQAIGAALTRPLVNDGHSPALCLSVCRAPQWARAFSVL